MHEIGHSLGLEHTNVRGAIMFPSYEGYRPELDLASDDIAGIQVSSVYGLYNKLLMIKSVTSDQLWTPRRCTGHHPATCQKGAGRCQQSRSGCPLVGGASGAGAH